MNIYEKLAEYNEDELAYKKYYALRNEPEKRMKWIQSLGTDTVLQRGLLFSEINSDFLISYEMGDELLNIKGTQDICLSKHNRYTPEFLHSHTFFEFIYVLSGSCANTVNGRTDTLTQGNLCIISPHTFHSLGVFDDSLILNILIRAETLEKKYTPMLLSKNGLSSFLINGIFADNHAAFFLFKLKKETELQDIILAMYQEQINNDDYSEEIINNLMMIFLYRLLRSSDSAASSTGKSIDDTAVIYQYFMEHYKEASLHEIADILGYTDTYTSAYIKRTTGFTFSKLLKYFRFRKAKELLKNTMLNVQHISELIGYNDCENFIRAFKKEVGVSPSVYRSQQ